MWPFKSKQSPPTKHGNAQDTVPNAVYNTSLPGSLVPVVTVEPREDPVRALNYGGPQNNDRVPVIEQVQSRPLPVDYTSFWNVGKDPQHAWAYRRAYTYTSIPEWTTVVNPNGFMIPKVTSALHPAMNIGAQNPIGQRANIAMADQVAYGDLTSLDPSVMAMPQYAKLV